MEDYWRTMVANKDKISNNQARERAMGKSLLWCAIYSVTLSSEQSDQVNLLPNADFFGLFSKSLKSQCGKLAELADNYKAQHFL